MLVKEDLKKGIVYFYTQRLGDSLSIYYEKSKVNLGKLDTFYTQELNLRGISATFTFNPSKKTGTKTFLTQPVNTELRRPYQKNFVSAAFESPDLYFIKKMKWLIITTLLLILVTITCFGYTVSTLLSQQKLNLLKDDFISNMTHEINTPLSSIKITTEALQNMAVTEERRKEYLGIIAYQSEKLSRLTEMILDGQNLQQKIPIVKRRIELQQLIQSTIDDLRVQIENTSTNFFFQKNTEPIYIQADPTLLQHAITNLIDNAIKYSETAPIITISVLINQKKATVSIADNGIGIPEEYYSKIFDRFFRVPKGNLHDVKGYGLGLDYVNQVIKQQNGTITVSGNKPNGSIFTIQVPLA